VVELATLQEIVHLLLRLDVSNVEDKDISREIALIPINPEDQEDQDLLRTSVVISATTVADLAISPGTAISMDPHVTIVVSEVIWPEIAMANRIPTVSDADPRSTLRGIVTWKGMIPTSVSNVDRVDIGLVTAQRRRSWV